MNVPLTHFTDDYQYTGLTMSLDTNSHSVLFGLVGTINLSAATTNSVVLRLLLIYGEASTLL